MKSVGEVMTIGRTFREALGKAVRSLETGRTGFDLELPRRPRPSSSGAWRCRRPSGCSRSPTRCGSGVTRRRGPRAHQDRSLVPRAHASEIVEREESAARPRARRRSTSRAARRSSASASPTAASPRSPASRADDVRARRKSLGVAPVYKRVDTCAAEFVAHTPYLYSTYEDERRGAPDATRRRSSSSAAGPNRIGQGIEFDYCCVHAVQALREEGFETIMVNCNPETVSTDYDTSDRLYFEPLTLEDVLNICDVEKPDGVIVQFGGQTPLQPRRRRSAQRGRASCSAPRPTPSIAPRIASASAQVMEKLGLKAPPCGTATHRRRGARGRRAHRLPGAGAAVVRARRARHGDRATTATQLAGYVDARHRVAGGRRREEPAAPRSLPEGRHRGRRRRRLRRHRDGHRRRDGAHRGGRHPLGRLGLRAAAALAAADDRRDHRGAGHGAGPGARRHRPDERAVRGQGRRRLPPRGEPARVAHGAVRVEGDGPAAGEDRRARDGRPDARRARRARDRAAARRRQGGGVPVREVPRHRHDARPRDALDRRGDGHRQGLRRSPSPRRRSAPARGCRPIRGRRRLHQRARRGQGGGARGRARLLALGFAHRRHARHRRASSASAASPADGVNKVLEGRPHCVDAIVNGEIALVVNTTVGGAGDPRLVQHPPHGADQGRALLHDDGGGARRGAGDRVRCKRGALDVRSLQEYHS